MIIKFERRTDQPDAAGRYKVYLMATFDRQRLRLSMGERCLTSEWNEEKERFRMYRLAIALQVEVIIQPALYRPWW